MSRKEEWEVRKEKKEGENLDIPRGVHSPLIYSLTFNICTDLFYE